MKTLILTGCDKSMYDVLDLTIPSKQKYAAKHGYDFMSVRSFPGDAECGLEERHIGFQRTVLAFKLLRHYESVMWVDADSVITNFDYKIEDFINGDESYIASYDWMHKASFSSGNFIARKTPKTQEFFNYFLQISKMYLELIVADQGALNHIHSQYRDRNFINILDHKYLNGVPEFLVETDTWKNDNNRTGIMVPWNEDHFLAHFTGTDNHERIQLIKANKLGLKS